MTDKPWEYSALWTPGWCSVGEVAATFRAPKGLPLTFRRGGFGVRARHGDTRRRAFVPDGWAAPFYTLQDARLSRAKVTRIDGGVEATLRQLARLTRVYGWARLSVVADAGPDALWALAEAADRVP